MIVERFTFPGGLCFEIETDDQEALAYFQAEYSWARGGEKQDDMLFLRWTREAWPSRRHPTEVIHTHKVIARWAYRVEWNGEDRLDLDVRGNWWALSMVHHMLVHSGLRFLASRRGILMFHSAALERGGKSAILTGPGGTGKTTVSSLLLAEGDADWSYHADDYVIIDPGECMSYAYPTRAHLYGNLLSWVPQISARLSRSEKRKVHFFGLLRSITADGVTWPTRVSLERLWPERSLAEQAILGGIFILARKDMHQPEVRRLHQREVPVETLLEMNFGEARHFVELMRKAAVWEAHPGGLVNWHDREREALETLSAKVPFFELVLPISGGQVDHGKRIEALITEVMEGEVRGS